MAGRADIQAGKAHIELYVKNSALVKGLASMKQQLQGLGTQIMGIGGALTGMGAAIVVPVIAAVSHFMNLGSTLADTSARTSVAASTLAEYGYAAGQTGASLEDVEKALLKMQKNGFQPGQFDQLAAEIAGIEDPAKRTQRAMEVFGKGGAALLPMMANLAELRAEAVRLGVVPTDEAVANADALGDAWDGIKSVVTATIFEIGAALGPMLLPALETVKTIASAFNRWAKENGALIRTVALVGAGVLAAGVIITGLGAALFAAGTLAGMAATAIGFLGSAVAFMVSPMGLAIAAVVGIGAALGAGVFAWARYTESGRNAVTWISGQLGQLLAFGRKVFGGIADAMMAGDLTLAAQIAWAAVMIVFETAKLQMMKSWFALRSSLIAAWGEVSLAIQTSVAFIAKVFTGLLDQLVPGWQFGMKLIGFAVAAAWKTFKDTAMGAFAVVRSGLDILIGRLQSFLKGLQIATKTAIQIAPKAIAGAGAGANDEIKKFLGVDVGKLLGDATDTAGEANAAGRAKLEADKAARGGADNAALAEQEGKIAAREADLNKLTAAAKAAREKAEADKNNIKAPDITEASGRGSFATFSAAGLAAQGGGGGPMADLASNTKEARKEAYQQRRELLKATYELEKTMRKAGLLGA